MYKVDSFLLDATNENLVNASPDEHGTKMWKDVRALMQHHRSQIEKGETVGTVSPRLAETLGIMETLTSAPLYQLATEIKERYQRLQI